MADAQGSWNAAVWTRIRETPSFLKKIIMKLDEQNRIIMGGMKLLVWLIFAQALLFFSYTNYLHPQWMWSDILRYWPK